MELDTTIEEKIITSCKEMKGWIKFLAIVWIICGGLYALTIIGIIVAWIPIWLGTILLKVSNNCGEVAEAKEGSLVNMFASLKSFFLLTGIFTIISIALSFIWFIIFGIAMIVGIMGEAGGVY